MCAQGRETILFSGGGALDEVSAGGAVDEVSAGKAVKEAESGGGAASEVAVDGGRAPQIGRAHV